MEKISSVKRFFLGIDQEKIKNLKSNLNIKDQQIQQTKLLLEKIDWEEEQKENFEKNLIKIEEDIKQQQSFLKQQNSSFSIWGWLSGLFR
jgi:predicted RNA-binding protein with RPS1 domain